MYFKYESSANSTSLRLAAWSPLANLLCALSVDLRRLRCELAVEGNEGCVEEVKFCWNDSCDVVDRTKGKGILPQNFRFSFEEHQHCCWACDCFFLLIIKPLPPKFNTFVFHSLICLRLYTALMKMHSFAKHDGKWSTESRPVPKMPFLNRLVLEAGSAYSRPHITQDRCLFEAWAISVAM